MIKTKYQTDMNTRKEIDNHLKAMASLRATLGTDSLVKEREEVNKKCREHLRAIKELDKEFHDIINLDK